MLGSVASLNKMLEAFRLSQSDYQKIIKGLKRIPNQIELSVFSAMWSEHCSYRTSKQFLKELPSNSEDVLCGPGENAGAVRISAGWAATFKMESHNHPSMIEPYNGAATGVGGILRDIFSMGARPISITNSLRFGDINHKGMKRLISGVISGIGGYGNSFGVANVTGECEFLPDFNNNILVNALALGIVKENKLIKAIAPGINRECWYVGSSTGRDGIHGAAMASKSFAKNSASLSRTTIQVGDPFTGKRLMEACLEANNNGFIDAMQDMGAAGIISSSLEMVAKAGLGIYINLDAVPLRDQTMTASDILLSESQERMLLFPKLGKEQNLKEIFIKHDLLVVPIGKTDDSKLYRASFKNTEVVNLPVTLVENAPSISINIKAKNNNYHDVMLKEYQKPIDNISKYRLLSSLLVNPNVASKSSIWQQLDWLIQDRTLKGPSHGGAAVIDVPEANVKLALSSQGSTRHCKSNSYSGALWVATKSWLDVICSNSKPIAFTDNLNFGNPEDSKVIQDFANCIAGLKKAGKELNCPYISGNVSFYNQTDGESIPAMPIVSALGIVENNQTFADTKISENHYLMLLGDEANSLIGSRLMEDIKNTEVDNLAYMKTVELDPINLSSIKNSANFIIALWHKKLIVSANTPSAGLLPSLIKLALRNQVGLDITYSPIKENNDDSNLAFWFGENTLPIIISTTCPDKIKELAKEKNIKCILLGRYKSDNNYIRIQDIPECTSLKSLSQPFLSIVEESIFFDKE